jgi:hypothetical protein
MREKRDIGAVVLMAMLPLMAGAYVGAYLLLSEPTVSVAQASDGGLDVVYGDRFGGGGQYTEAFFWPLTQLDRQLRPERWQDMSRFTTGEPHP